MSGFGLSAIGTGSFGLGTPDEPPEQATGNVGIRWINPATKDYEVDPGTHNLKQMPGVRQQVMLAVSTIQRTATSAPRFGVALPNKMGNTFEAECKNATRLALNHLIAGDPPLIKINFITVTKGRNSRAEILIDYIDLTTGEPDQVTN
jgi:hypothetical protein